MPYKLILEDSSTSIPLWPNAGYCCDDCDKLLYLQANGGMTRGMGMGPANLQTAADSVVSGTMTPGYSPWRILHCPN